MKILRNIDLADEGSPAKLVDSMWEAGNKKTLIMNVLGNILII